MTLATHAILGTAAARIFPGNNAVAFAAAFVSHFLADAIPHWDYFLKSYKKDFKNRLNDDMRIDRNFLLDLSRIGLDFFLGAAISYFIFRPADVSRLVNIAIGIFGGTLPDALQLVYFKTRKEPLTSLQRLHGFIHAKKRLTGRPVLGIFLQLIFVFAVVSISYAIN